MGVDAWVGNILSCYGESCIGPPARQRTTGASTYGLERLGHFILNLCDIIDRAVKHLAQYYSPSNAT